MPRASNGPTSKLKIHGGWCRWLYDHGGVLSSAELEDHFGMAFIVGVYSNLGANNHGELEDVQSAFGVYKIDAGTDGGVCGTRPPAYLMLFVTMLFSFILFMIGDKIALILIVIPMYRPLLKLLGFHPVWF